MLRTPKIIDQIKDLLVDVRCGYRDDRADYAIECEMSILRLATSTNPKMDKYGYYYVGS